MLRRVVLRAVTLLMVGPALWAAEPAPQAIVDYARSSLPALGSDPVVVAAVRAENRRSKGLDHIKGLDQAWRESTGIPGYMRAWIDSECGRHLQQIRTSKPFYTLLFAMDDQGTNVAMTDKLARYWHGEEALFSSPFRSGAVWVSDMQFDEAAQAWVVYASVPVRDGSVTIGVLTVGIEVDAFEASTG